jgi:hypothetical protein
MDAVVRACRLGRLTEIYEVSLLSNPFELFLLRSQPRPFFLSAALQLRQAEEIPPRDTLAYSP